MKVEFNIGLDVAGARNSLHDCTLRARQAINIIKSTGIRYQVERISSQYEGPDGTIHLEQTLVVELSVYEAARIASIRSLAYEIAVALSQDCVAVFWPATERGELIGPNAVKWGDFNINFFKTFAEVSLPRVA